MLAALCRVVIYPWLFVSSSRMGGGSSVVCVPAHTDWSDVARNGRWIFGVSSHWRDVARTVLTLLCSRDCLLTVKGGRAIVP